MGANVTVKVDLKGLEKKCSPEAVRRGQIAMSNQMLLDMNKYTPVQSGHLRGSGHSNVDTLVWSTPYARIRFYNRRLKLFFSEKQRKFFLRTKTDCSPKNRNPELVGVGIGRPLRNIRKNGAKWLLKQWELNK